LDRKEEFEKRVEEVTSILKSNMEKLSKMGANYCLVWISIMGISELLLKIFEKVEIFERIKKNIEWIKVLPEDAGKYFILLHAEQIVNIMDSSGSYPLPECMSEKKCISDKWESCQKIWKKLAWHFHAVDHIADVYMIQPQSEMEGEESTLRVLG
jgi:hypothetical protein